MSEGIIEVGKIEIVQGENGFSIVQPDMDEYAAKELVVRTSDGLTYRFGPGTGFKVTS